MSSGSGASNLGYGNVTPLSNINDNYANVHNSHNSANFSSTVVPGLPWLSGAKNNHVASGIMKGGKKSFIEKDYKILKRKIKNITKHYKKMKHGSKRSKHIKRTLKRNSSSKKKSNGASCHGRKRKPKSRRHRQRGGYGQYQNNMPISSIFKVAGVDISPDQSWSANPPPISVVGGNQIDNYNHFTGKGFPSAGH